MEKNDSFAIASELLCDNELNSISFNIMKYSDDELVPKLYSMFEYLDLISTFSINPDKLQ